ncbi:MAG: hypothetical protein ACREQA_09740 [Candidatus Binatia bacterium]
MKAAIILGLIVASVIVSRLFIFSFRHIPLTDQAGGQEPLYALVGGGALAFSLPTIPLLVLYLAVLFTARKPPSETERDYGVTLLPVTLFLLAFVAAFVIGISGVPSVIANPIYNGRKVIDVIGGLLVALYGLRAFTGLCSPKAFWFKVLSKKQSGLLLEEPILGFTAGLLLFHLLDPSYDSVFFFTGRAGAFSHHPISVVSFGLGVSVMYGILAYGFSLLASRRVANVTTWVRRIVGVLTLILGLSWATGTFSLLTAVVTNALYGRGSLMSGS